VRGPGSSVDIATGYGLDGPGIESRRGARFSPPVQTGLGAHPASCTMGTGSFQGVKGGRGVTLTPHHLLVPLSRKSRAIPLLPPYGPYGLYRASVPVQGWPLPFFLKINCSETKIQARWRILEKCPVIFVMFFCLSVHPHVSARLLADGFPWNSMHADLYKQSVENFKFG